MSYITSIERIGRREGQNEGVLVGKIQGFENLLGRSESSSEDLLRLSKVELQARYDQLGKEIRQKLDLLNIER